MQPQYRLYRVLKSTVKRTNYQPSSDELHDLQFGNVFCLNGKRYPWISACSSCPFSIGR